MEDAQVTQRTPLSMEFTPSTPLEGGRPIVVVEPSFREAGNVFVGIHPFGERQGVDLTADEVRSVRDHLSKLLHEKAPVTTENWTERIAKAVEAQRPKRDWIAFRFGGRIGKFEFVVGRGT